MIENKINNTDNCIERFNMLFDLNKIKKELTRETYICNYTVPSRTDTKGALSRIDTHANMNEQWRKFDNSKGLKELAENRNIYPWWVKFEFRLYWLVYNEEYIRRHTPAIMKNLELNLNYFDKLNYEDFNTKFQDFLKLKSNSNIKEVSDLNLYKKSSGIYILVLDKYKQVYIGQATKSITQRIVRHWSRKIEFDSILVGKTNETKISIDSFGIMDTTRIFVEEIDSMSKIDSREEFLIKHFPKEYILNKIGGGIKFETSADFDKFMKTYQRRKLE